MNIWTKLKKPFFVLAPMAGYTDAAFRLLCREFGADIVMTELISADAIAYSKIKMQKTKIKIKEEYLIYNKCEAAKNHATAEMLSFFETERPLIVQLFGKYPEKFALAAKWVTENLPIDGIDINMGCPARKVVGSDHGAALLKNPDLAVEIVKAVKANTHLPVSVKTRLGWDNDDQILEFAPKLVEAGVSAITIHGRTYKDGFKGKARWENIYRVKEMMGDQIVVIGNGDVDSVKLKAESLKPVNNDSIENSQLTHNSALNAQYSVLDGIAIGRGSFGKPWIFSPGKDILSKDELAGVIRRHAELLWVSKGEKGMLEFRKHLLCYLKGFEGAKELRLQAVKVEKLQDVEDLLSKL